ncbi:hypothetical protein L249_6204, partial [Ophiocordyceps polyrhachis-furcata BCC 54312]
QARRAFFSNTISLRGVVFPPPKLVTETGGLSGVFFTMLRYSFALPAAADPEGPFDYRLPRGGEDEGPAPADLETFFLPTAGESTADSTLFFFDLCGRYGYGYGYGKRPRCYGPSTASSFPLERPLRPDFFGCFFRPYGRPTLASSKDSPPTLRRHEARRPKTKDTIDWLEKHAFFCRKVGPGPDESTEHSYGLFQALPKEIQVQLYDKLERPSSSPYGILFST